MLRPEIEKWGQSAEDMRRLSIEAEHPRSRERFQALYMMSSGQSNASRWAKTIKRCQQTVLEWVHHYNAAGPNGVVYHHSGGRKPTLNASDKEKMIVTVKQDKPSDYQLPGYGWTLKKLRQWVERHLGQRVSRTTLRNYLKRAGLSWKKSKKLLGKAKPQQRAEFVAHFQTLFAQVCQEKIRLIYIDEAHFHQDLDVGYRWSVVGAADWVYSSCPSRQNRLNWYGAYDFTHGQCLLWQQETCNSEQTIAFLQEVARWQPNPSQQTVIIWDGAPWHKTANVRQEAEKWGLQLIPLPSYSPDLNPIEGLWKWMREDLTQHHCYSYLYQLERACLDFITRINLNPEAIITRLWPKFELDPSYENVLLSFRF